MLNLVPSKLPPIGGEAQIAASELAASPLVRAPRLPNLVPGQACFPPQRDFVVGLDIPPVRMRDPVRQLAPELRPETVNSTSTTRIAISNSIEKWYDFPVQPTHILERKYPGA